MKKHIIFDCDGTLIDTHGRYKLFPQIKELLEVLSIGNSLYVWTGRDRLSTQRVLEELGVLKYFDNLCCAEDAVSKPHVSGLQLLLGKTSKQSICVIGDSGFDMLGAKNFGVLAIGAVWSLEAKSHVLKEFGADFIVSHPAECSKLIEQNVKGDDYV